MSPNNQARALILGHSFIRRLRDFVQNDKKGSFLETMNIDEKGIVHWHGTGDQMVEKTNDQNSQQKEPRSKALPT